MVRGVFEDAALDLAVENLVKSRRRITLKELHCEELLFQKNELLRGM